MAIDLKELFGDISHLNKKAVMSLLQAIKEKHTADFDYLKFRKSILNLQELDMDEQTSIKSAYATASTIGLSKSALSKSAKTYLRSLQSEKEKFAETLQRQVGQKVESHIAEAKKMEKAAADHEAKIAQLQKEIELMRQKQEQSKAKAVEAQKKIEKTRDQFVEAYDYIYATIEQDIEKYEDIL